VVVAPNARARPQPMDPDLCGSSWRLAAKKPVMCDGTQAFIS